MGYQKGYYNLPVVVTHSMEYPHNQGVSFVVMGALLLSKDKTTTPFGNNLHYLGPSYKKYSLKAWPSYI